MFPLARNYLRLQRWSSQQTQQAPCPCLADILLRKTKHKHDELTAIYYVRKVPGRKKIKARDLDSVCMWGRVGAAR